MANNKLCSIKVYAMRQMTQCTSIVCLVYYIEHTDNEVEHVININDRAYHFIYNG